MNDEILRQLYARTPPGSGLEFPPKIFVEMGGQFVAYDEGRSLQMRFPVQERYQNPLGYMQGGLIIAAMDNTLGSLSFLVAPPSVTTHLNTTFLRPVTPSDAYIDVWATVEEITRHWVHLRAEARNPAGKRVASCTASFIVLGETHTEGDGQGQAGA